MGGGSSTIKKLQAELERVKNEKTVADDYAKQAQEPHILIFNDFKGYNEMYMLRLSEAPEYLTQHFHAYSVPQGDVYEMFAEDWAEKASPPITRTGAAWQWLTEGKRSTAISGRTWNIANVIYLKCN
tara:strand:+ start:68 stop:448 length:381 start_codon:yes stop_codon:yes gene_type:complete